MQTRTPSMPIDINRPQSALRRGVRITEFQSHIINPDPIVLQETDFLLDEFLSPTKLRALTGVTDLALVDNLEMVVDTSETSLGNFGIYLPFLKQLKLNNSHVPRIRDLGTSLVNLKVLWLSRSGLTDLDGIPTLSNLEEVYLAFNEITDLSPCSMLENLKCLDLEGNLIDDIKQVEFLNLCSNLSNLTLYGNPVCALANKDDEDNSYRDQVVKMLPGLKILDDELTVNDGASVKKIGAVIEQSASGMHECPFDDDWQLINQFIEEGIGPSEEKLAINESLRPGTSSSRTTSSPHRITTGVRPLSSMRPLSSLRIKTARPTSRHTPSPATHSNLIKTPDNNDTAHQQSMPSNDSSELTTGPALQGNPLKALLARKTNRNVTAKAHLSQQDAKQALNVTYESAVMQLNEMSSLHNEVNEWRKEHAEKLKERKEYFQPQILKIDDDDDDDEGGGGGRDLESVCSDVEETLEEEETEWAVGGMQGPEFKQSFDYEVERSRSDASGTRLATGDTGYESSLSRLSYLEDGSSSVEMGSGSLSYNLRPVRPPSGSSIHKPKIFTTTVTPTSVTAPLKSLKTNLKPLPGIRAPKS